MERGPIVSLEMNLRLSLHERTEGFVDGIVGRKCGTDVRRQQRQIGATLIALEVLRADAAFQRQGITDREKEPPYYHNGRKNGLLRGSAQCLELLAIHNVAGAT